MNIEKEIEKQAILIKQNEDKLKTGGLSEEYRKEKENIISEAQLIKSYMELIKHLPDNAVKAFLLQCCYVPILSSFNTQIFFTNGCTIDFYGCFVMWDSVNEESVVIECNQGKIVINFANVCYAKIIGSRDQNVGVISDVEVINPISNAVSDLAESVDNIADSLE